MALQSVFDRLHRGLAEYNALGIDRAAECDDGMDPLPRHTLRVPNWRIPPEILKLLEMLRENASSASLSNRDPDSDYA